jgi:DHA1 family bicyclomycin/chloramphenicol resistance-like MFS transporter
VSINSESAPPKAPNPWGLIALLGALTAMGPLAIDMYLPSLPAIGADLRASAGETSGTVAAFLAGMAIGQLLYGPASDRFGRRPPILVGTAIFVLASAGCALAETAGLLTVGRFIQGLGACAGGVVSRAVVRDRFDHTETARTLSLMMLIMGLAPILAPLVGGGLLALGGWRSIFWFMAAFGVAVSVAAWLRLKESRSAETAAQARSEHPIQAYITLLKNRRIAGYALAGALNGATLFTYIAASPELLIEIYKIPAAHFGWVFGVNAAGVIGAGQINRALLKRRTPDEVLAKASLASVGLCGLLALAAASGIGGAWTVLPMLFVVLASYGLMQGNTMAGALSADPHRSGTISALTGAASMAVGALAAAASGVLHDGTPRPMAFVMFVALCGSALALRSLALPKTA